MRAFTRTVETSEYTFSFTNGLKEKFLLVKDSWWNCTIWNIYFQFKNDWYRHTFNETSFLILTFPSILMGVGGKKSSINMLTFCIIKICSQQVREGGKKIANYELLYYWQQALLWLFTKFMMMTTFPSYNAYLCFHFFLFENFNMRLVAVHQTDSIKKDTECRMYIC